MKNTVLVLALLLLPASTLALSAEPAGDDSALAIVTLITGHAVWLEEGTKEKVDLPMFCLLREADQIRTDRGASVKLAFFSGEAFLVAEKSHAIVTRTGLKMKKGKCQSLGRLDALPELQPIASRERPGLTMTGFKVRSATEHPPIMVLASRPAIAVAPVAEVEKYHFSLRNAGGEEVFCCTTSSTSIGLPADILEPGRDYRLDVRAEGEGPGRYVWRDRLVKTVSGDEEKAREAILAKFQATGDVSWLLLLVEIDWRLGLEVDACREYLQAVRLVPGNPAVTEIGNRIGCGN